ncbi:hypothetical protein [Candidatus Thiodiazotropha endoloripes]|uniref:hypothetical protein n=1 Tax=Candidatus Thiodiazotropha endoloripes TaxID=1818881 RepID=UPI001112AF2C|nr:hypothetical protein [Candidatus Thiodiazotropha endoloripes]
MNLLLSKSLPLALLFSLFVGCGGGGGQSDSSSNNEDSDADDINLDITTFEYIGNESPAIVTSSNLVQLAYAVAQTVKNLGLYDVILQTEMLRTTRPLPSDSTSSLSLTSDPHCVPTGSSTSEHNVSGTISKYSFTDCGTNGRDRNGTYYVSGFNTIVHEDSLAGPFVSILDGEVLDEKGYLARIHRTLRCDFDSCVFVVDYFSDDDFVYRMTDIYRTSRSRNTGIQVSGRAYHPDLGYVEFETDSDLRIDLNCESTHPSVGRVVFSGSNNLQGSIDFISCTQYVVSNGSSSYVMNW